MLFHGAETEGLGPGAKASRRELVFDVEDGLARVYESLKPSTFGVVEALFVDREVEARLKLADLPQVVFQPGGQTSSVSRMSQPAVVSQLICARKRKTGAVLVTVDVVELDSVESLVAAPVQTGLMMGFRICIPRMSSHRSPVQPLDLPLTRAGKAPASGLQLSELPALM